MSEEIVKQPPQAIDGFAGYQDAVEGGEEQSPARIIEGELVRFTNEVSWVVNDEELPLDLELVAINIIRVVQRWHDAKPLETRVLQPGEKFPDINKLNAEVPQSEWEEGPDGRPRGPWQAQHIVYLLAPQKMGKYTFATGTIGGAIAVRDLVDRTQWMRRFRGTNVFPVVRLTSVHMNTRFGGRQRPRFDVVKWIMLDDVGNALPAPDQPKLSDHQGVQEVKPPSTAEDMDDSIPF